MVFKPNYLCDNWPLATPSDAMTDPQSIPHSGDYTPPWRVVPCETFDGAFAIADTGNKVVALGLTKTMAEDWKRQLDETGFIDHDLV